MSDNMFDRTDEDQGRMEQERLMATLLKRNKGVDTATLINVASNNIQPGTKNPLWNGEGVKTVTRPAPAPAAVPKPASMQVSPEEQHIVYKFKWDKRPNGADAPGLQNFNEANRLKITTTECRWAGTGTATLDRTNDVQHKLIFNFEYFEEETEGGELIRYKVTKENGLVLPFLVDAHKVQVTEVLSGIQITLAK